MKTREQIAESMQLLKLRGTQHLLLEGLGSSEFVGNVSAAIALEWVLEEGEGLLDLREQAKKPPVADCADTDGDGECDTHDHSDGDDHNKALNAGGRED